MSYQPGMFASVQQHLHARSVTLLAGLESRLARVAGWWMGLALMASALRIATSPLPRGVPELGMVLPYVLLVLAPAVSLWLAFRWFADGAEQAQPATRLAVIGRWRSVDAHEQRRHPLYGTSGFMVSLMVGMLLNVPIRALEYWAGVPAISGAAPGWARTLHLMMTMDVVLLSSLYVVAFAAALRKVPLFPRLLAAIWAIDLVMQVAIAEVVARSPGLPGGVAEALHTILGNNIEKTLISVALWLPYLLLSTRVNVTFRKRLPA